VSTAGTDLLLEVERPAAGGRMIARHDGRVVLVAGAIPGERVRARVERAERGVIWATVVEVLVASPDRRPVTGDPACGGCVFAHVGYGRQIALKREIVIDAFRRIGKTAIEMPVPVEPSPEREYRLRARLHGRGGRIGFFREGTHDLCDSAQTGQLRTDTSQVLAAVGGELGAAGAAAVRSIELSENLAADERALHIELRPGGPPPATLSRLARVAGVTGVTGQAPPADPVLLGGRPWVSDTVETLTGRPAGTLGGSSVRRRPNAFFQANRFLIPALVSRVAGNVGDGPVVDLYAGVGLFAVALAALGQGEVVAVEGDVTNGADLAANAKTFGAGLRVERSPVETFLAGWTGRSPGTLLVDPPRTGISRVAMDGVIAVGAPRIVYVSCDVATLARDVRRLVDAGYALRGIEAFDLFPNTAHVESVVTLTRTPRRMPRTAIGTRQSARSSPGATARPHRTARPTAPDLR
jgi:23S rRNA (uracil1939-C5)-methyltransferase